MAEYAHPKFQAARVVGGFVWPYLSHAAQRLAYRKCEPVGTMAVDKYWRIYVCETWLEKQSVEQIATTIFCHELCHLLFAHDRRLKHYPGDIPNVAGDLAINSTIREAAEVGTKYAETLRSGGLFKRQTKMEPPAGILYPEAFKDGRGNPFPVGLLAEEYAELLVKYGKKNGIDTSGKFVGLGNGDGGSGSHAHPGGGNCGSGADGKKREWEDGPPDGSYSDGSVSPAEAEVMRRQVAEEVRKFAEKNRGYVPGGWDRWADVQLTPPKIPWQRKLQAAVRYAVQWASGCCDYTYTRPNRRSMSTSAGVRGDKAVLPAMWRPLPRVLVAVDTSGSMGADDFSAAFSEVQGVLSALGLRSVPVMCVDAAVHSIQSVSKATDIKLKGGGGTDMSAAIVAAAGMRAATRPQVLIIMTDGYTGWPAEPVDGMKVVACVTNSGHGPVPGWIDTVTTYD